MADDKAVELELTDPAATERLAGRLADALPAGFFAIALAGPLGAGKSALSRALLQALGVEGAIPSPTYTLIEPYSTSRGPAYHMDFYRLESAEEAGYLGLDDILEEPALCLVEWPERGSDTGLAFDLDIDLAYAGEGRMVRIEARTGAGQSVVDHLQETP